MPGRVIGLCPRIRGSVFIRSVSATPVVACALNTQDESSSSSLTTTNASVLTSPQLHTLKVVSPEGTVTLVENWSGTVGFGAAAMKHRSVVHLSGNDGRGDFPPDREAVSISVRHSGAVSRCRPGRKCGEMPRNADKNRCACPGDVNRFIARSRCLVG